MRTARSTPGKLFLSESLLLGAVELAVAGVELEDMIEGAEEVLVLVEVIDDVAMVKLPLTGPAVTVPEDPEDMFIEDGETGTGMITAGPVTVEVAEPEVGADEVAPVEL